MSHMCSPSLTMYLLLWKDLLFGSTALRAFSSRYRARNIRESVTGKMDSK